MEFKKPEKILFSEEEIAEKINSLGAEITAHYADLCSEDNPLVALCILKGSFIFFSELIRKIQLPLVCEFMGVSSYGNSTESSGEVRMTLDLQGSIMDKHVLIIEDIVDTGLTIDFLNKSLKARNPKSLRVCSLLFKPESLKTATAPDYIGFEIARQFAVGYGVDYAGQYRQLPYISELES